MKIVKMTMFALATVVALSGCGSSSNNDSPGSSGSNGSNAANLSSINGSSGGFIAYVRSVVAQSPDNTEAVNVDGITATADDTGEPEAI